MARERQERRRVRAKEKERERGRESALVDRLCNHDNRAGRAGNRNIQNVFLLRPAHVAQHC